jgi:hypothetical protein
VLFFETEGKKAGARGGRRGHALRFNPAPGTLGVLMAESAFRHAMADNRPVVANRPIGRHVRQPQPPFKRVDGRKAYLACWWLTTPFRHPRDRGRIIFEIT